MNLPTKIMSGLSPPAKVLLQDVGNAGIGVEAARGEARSIPDQALGRVELGGDDRMVGRYKQGVLLNQAGVLLDEAIHHRRMEEVFRFFEEEEGIFELSTVLQEPGMARAENILPQAGSEFIVGDGGTALAAHIEHDRVVAVDGLLGIVEVNLKPHRVQHRIPKLSKPLEYFGVRRIEVGPHHSGRQTFIAWIADMLLEGLVPFQNGMDQQGPEFNCLFRADFIVERIISPQPFNFLVFDLRQLRHVQEAVLVRLGNVVSEEIVAIVVVPKALEQFGFLSKADAIGLILAVPFQCEGAILDQFELPGRLLVDAVPEKEDLIAEMDRVNHSSSDFQFRKKQVFAFEADNLTNVLDEEFEQARFATAVGANQAHLVQDFSRPWMTFRIEKVQAEVVEAIQILDEKGGDLHVSNEL